MKEEAAPGAGEKVRLLSPGKMLLNVREVSTLLSLSERTVWKMASCGELPAPVSIGRSKRWSKDALEEWIGERHKAAQRN